MKHITLAVAMREHGERWSRVYAACIPDRLSDESLQLAQSIRRTLVKDDPNDMRAKEGLSNTHSYIAGLLRQKGDLAGAVASYKESLALRQSLSEKDTANENLHFKVAQSESGIGDVYAAMAFRPGVASTDALGYCRESEKWNRRALPVWLQMKTEGKVAGSDLEAIPRIKENVDRCRPSRCAAEPLAATIPTLGFH